MKKGKVTYIRMGKLFILSWLCRLMKEKLKTQAVQSFENLIKYYHVIMDDFPEDKLEERLGNALSPLELLQHVGGTPGWWMKRRGTRFDFSSSIKSRDHFFEVLNMQLNAFKTMLEDPKELYWKSKDESKPQLSIPWIMIRSYYHAIHHGAMLIHYRHIYGLPPLNFGDDLDWGMLVDLPGDLFYSDLQ